MKQVTIENIKERIEFLEVFERRRDCRDLKNLNFELACLRKLVAMMEQLQPDAEPAAVEIECDICGHVSTDPEGRHYCCEDNSDD